MKTTKNTKNVVTDSTKFQCLPLHGMWGILLLFVFASIAYSTYIVAMGTHGLAPKIMLVPQALFAIVIALYKFSSK